MKRWFFDPANLSLWAGSLALVMSAGCGQEAEGPGRFVAPPDARPVAFHKQQVIIADGPVTEFQNPFVQEREAHDLKSIQRTPPADAKSNNHSPAPAKAAPVTQAPLLSLSPSRPGAETLSVDSPKPESASTAEGPVLLIDPRSGSHPSNGNRGESPRRIPAPSSPVSAELAQSPKPSENLSESPRMERTPPVLLLGESRKSKSQAPSTPSQGSQSQDRASDRPSEASTPIQRPSADTVVKSQVQQHAAPSKTAPIDAQSSEQRQVVDLKIPAPVHVASIPMHEVPMAPTAADARTMDAVRMRARGLVENGMSLAHRGAYYSARAEFIQAMRLITQTLDTQQSTREHSAALSSGLVALDEASAFIPEGAKLEADLDLPMIIRSHRTPALKGEALDEVTPLAAVQAYFGYAQEKLRFAAGGVPEASQALFGLAKLQEYLHGGESENRALIGPRSIALHQTALTIDPTHAEAANELGVLLARYGQYEDAKQALLQGLRSRQYAESWNNLARVHELLGENDLAQLARQEAAAPHSRGGDQVVRWTTPDEFTDEGRPTLQQPSPATSRPAESTARGGSRAASRR